MWDFCVQSEPIARKEYQCEAWEWLYNVDWYQFTELTFSERKAIARAKRNNFEIKPGEKYLKVQGKWDGEFQTFRAIPSLDAICRKYDVYEE